jgi:hypothetical protein
MKMNKKSPVLVHGSSVLEPAIFSHHPERKPRGVVRSLPPVRRGRRCSHHVCLLWAILLGSALFETQDYKSLAEETCLPEDLVMFACYKAYPKKLLVIRVHAGSKAEAVGKHPRLGEYRINPDG